MQTLMCPGHPLKYNDHGNADTLESHEEGPNAPILYCSFSYSLNVLSPSCLLATTFPPCPGYTSLLHPISGSPGKPLTLWFPTGGNFASSSLWRHFWLSYLGGVELLVPNGSRPKLLVTTPQYPASPPPGSPTHTHTQAVSAVWMVRTLLWGLPAGGSFYICRCNVRPISKTFTF